MQAVMRFGEAIHRAAQAAPGAEAAQGAGQAAGSRPSGAGPDVVDAEFEEADGSQGRDR